MFLAPTTATLADFIPEDGEVSGLFAAPVSELLDLFLGACDTVTVTGLTGTRTLTARDFCCYEDRVLTTGYYLKVIQAIDALLKGNE